MYIPALVINQPPIPAFSTAGKNGGGSSGGLGALGVFDSCFPSVNRFQNSLWRPLHLARTRNECYFKEILGRDGMGWEGRAGLVSKVVSWVHGLLLYVYCRTRTVDKNSGQEDGRIRSFGCGRYRDGG